MGHPSASASRPEVLARALRAHERGELSAAEALYRQLLARDASDFDALHLLGTLAFQRNQYELALRLIDRALSLKPQSAAAWTNLGNVLQALNRLDEALGAYGRAIQCRPDFVNAWYNAGLILARQGNHGAAIASFDRTINLAPTHVEARYNRALSLEESGRDPEALTGYSDVLERAPDHFDAKLNRARVLASLQQFDAAHAEYVKLTLATVARWEPWCNLGSLEQLRGNQARAEEAFARALAIAPHEPVPIWNRALCRLAFGDYVRGWEDYEVRWKLPEHARNRPPSDQPLWLGGADLAGRTILLYPEQGLGDTLQFCRYALCFASLQAKVILLTPAPLLRLLESLPRPGHDIVLVREGDPIPRHDFRCPLLSLPQAFGTTLDTIPEQAPYLFVRPESVASWRARLSGHRAPRIGLVWAGAPRPDQPHAAAIDRRRSLALSMLAPLAHVAATFVSLQKGPAAAQLEQAPGRKERLPVIHDYTSELHDFADTAALIMALDLVVTCDTSVAHAAGALGRPVWILNRFDSCWRWLRGRRDSPWYPSAVLYRQQRPGDWGAVLEEVVLHLHAFVQTAADGAAK